MIENRFRPYSYWKERRRVRDTRLVDVREAWAEAPELPLAYKSRENIITISSLFGWRKSLNQTIRDGHGTLRKTHPKPLSRSEATREYHRLRFLSKSAAEAGMQAIAQDILANFDPSNTLINVPGGGGQLLYQMVADQLQDYGTIKSHWKYGDSIGNRGSFQGGSVDDAKTWINLDDWILSGQQVFGDARYAPNEAIAAGAFDPRWFNYHLVVSDRGKVLYDQFGLRGKAVYKLIGDDGPTAKFGKYRVYGYHKIPDVLPNVFADDARYPPLKWTIFPSVNGRAVGRNSRLLNY